jgi:AcrR family transcriptional regulator
MTPRPAPPADARATEWAAATRVGIESADIGADVVAGPESSPADGGEAGVRTAGAAAPARRAGRVTRGARRPPVEVTKPGGGSERPTLTREAIVSAALAIADDQGVDAVSMRRIASRLGVGTMTIYGHVRDKDELLTLMWDRVTAEQILPEVPADWREALATLARSARQCVLRHPWMIGLKPRLGDNVLLHIDQSLEAIGRLGVDNDQKLIVINVLDDLVAGCSIREIASGHAGVGHDPAKCGLRAKFRDSPELLARVRAGEFPHIADVLEEGRCIHSQRFERGLAWLLDGIERDHARTSR